MWVCQAECGLLERVGDVCIMPAGWSLECLQDWASFLRLAIPSMLMLCIEWWAYEIGSFLSGMCAEDGVPEGEVGDPVQEQVSSVFAPQVSLAQWSWEPNPLCMSWLSLCSW